MLGRPFLIKMPQDVPSLGTLSTGTISVAARTPAGASSISVAATLSNSVKRGQYVSFDSSRKVLKADTSLSSTGSLAIYPKLAANQEVGDTVHLEPELYAVYGDAFSVGEQTLDRGETLHVVSFDLLEYLE